jgi:hypothetical protein
MLLLSPVRFALRTLPLRRGVNRKENSTTNGAGGRESAEFCALFREERMDKDFAVLPETLRARGHPNGAEAA